jgi:hypothetical protein
VLSRSATFGRHRRSRPQRASEITSESRDEAPTFEKVVRLIAEEEFDVEWLADGLRGWIWPQERYPASARKYGHGLGMFADIARTRWSRAKVLKELKETLPGVADTLTDLMSDCWKPSPKAPRFESPQLHLEVAANRPGSPAPTIPRLFSALARKLMVCGVYSAGTTGLGRRTWK